VISFTVASTPPMPRGAVSSGTGLYAIVTWVSSTKPWRLTSSRMSSIQVAGPPLKGASMRGRRTWSISGQTSLKGNPIAFGCLVPRIGR